MSYPQHERFRELQKQLEAAKDFVEWFIENGPKVPACCSCSAFNDRVHLTELSENVKADLIMQCFGIDPREFEAEKLRMLAELRDRFDKG